ncbi:hypothetical protein [Marinifilum sp. D714]|uniref:Ig-like domain-containing protein n=1 Tax=Marinifilum sp. D714 TaxID=2937523 RepID=UPI0027C72BE4|nr:hypothetical protein [Marinifilum sp. D714]MDQ2179495.1 hypothetical protein [Marinifilum sp. D714]
MDTFFSRIVLFLFFGLLSGSLSAQTYTANPTNPTCNSCADGKIDVEWSYNAKHVNALRVKLYDSSWNWIQTDDTYPYSFPDLSVGTYIVSYEYKYKNDWNYISQRVVLTSSKVRIPFQQRTSQYPPYEKIYRIKGDFTMIGNTNLTLKNYSDNGNNSGDMVYVDVDSDPNTLNSSSATLDFSTENDAKPQCSNIVYAGLYWTGRSSTTNNSFPISKMGTVPQVVDEVFTVEDNDKVPYSDYSINVWRGDDGYEYIVVYDFSALGEEDVRFLFYNNGDIYYRIGTGAYNKVSSNVNTSFGIMTASFSPIKIYSEVGGIVLTIDELKRGSNVYGNDTYYSNTSEASGRVSGETKVETGNITKTYNKREIYIKHSGESAYQKITARADDIHYPTTSESSIFAAYAEVTDYVQKHGIGEYFVADMALLEGDGGGTGYSGGWGLVVVYENSKMKWRDVTLFDGYAYVQHLGGASTSYELPISGFKAVQSGDVKVKLGIMASEGDVNIAGDFIEIQNATQTNWARLNHDDNNTANFFNSSISTGGNSRNPNLVNNTGVDISMFDVPNSGNVNIANSQTSTKFRYGTSQDTYAIFALAMAVDAYVPEAEATNIITHIEGVTGEIVDGTIVEPGKTISYKMEIRNRGTEVVNDARLVLPIPYTTEYVSSSVNVGTVTYDVAEGATGSIVWEIGNLAVPSEGPDQILGTLTYTVKVTEDCSILGNSNCDPSVAVGGGGGSTGTGATSGTTISGFSIIQGYETDGDCVGEPIVTPVKIIIDAEDYVAANCTVEEINSDQEFFFCNLGPPASIPITEVSGNFPSGSRFYNDYPVVEGVTEEFTISNEFLADIGTTTYYAVPPGYTTCYYTFKITVKDVSSIPTVSDVTYCKDATANVIQATPSDPSYELYYYMTETDDTPLINFIPPTDKAGTITYYVAEGESATCLSPNRVPVVVTVNPQPKPIGIFFSN